MKRITKREIKRNRRILGLIAIAMMLLFILGCKGNKPKIIGYTYDSGNTVWEMAQRCCPNNMDIREVVREIERVNKIKNSIIYDSKSYKVPIYQTSDIINMNDIVDYEVTETGLMLYTADENGYYWERER